MTTSPSARRGEDRAKWRSVEGRHALRARADALAPRAADDPDRYLAELVRLHRAFTSAPPSTARSRSTGSWTRCAPCTTRAWTWPADWPGTIRWRAHGRWPRAWSTRSSLYAAARDFGPALADFRQALTRLEEPRLTRGLKRPEPKQPES
ncbi:hypothetical protein SCALM49S_07371 [Streptomyces californicus]